MRKRRFNWRYAIGEVLIVSVGILIAFSINTLSSNWKQKSAHKEYKASLLADLDRNLNNLDRITKAQKTKIVELNKVISTIESKNFDKDSISALLFKQRKSPTFYPINGTFKSLVTHGEIELFRTPIKRELFNLYDNIYERTVYNGSLYDKFYVEVYDIEIRDIIDFRTQKIDNIERLKSKDFIKNLLFIIDEADSYLKLIDKSVVESKKVRALIKGE